MSKKLHNLNKEVVRQNINYDVFLKLREDNYNIARKESLMKK